MSLTERSRVMGLLGAEAVEVRHVEQNLAAFEGVTVPDAFRGAEVYRLAHRDTGPSRHSAPCGVASVYLTVRVSLADAEPCPTCWPADKRLLGWLHGNTRPTARPHRRPPMPEIANTDSLADLIAKTIGRPDNVLVGSDSDGWFSARTLAASLDALGVTAPVSAESTPAQHARERVIDRAVDRLATITGETTPERRHNHAEWIVDALLDVIRAEITSSAVAVDARIATR